MLVWLLAVLQMDYGTLVVFFVHLTQTELCTRSHGGWYSCFYLHVLE